MIQVILGNKGSGKTVKLISLANDALKEEKGNIFFIDSHNRHMYDLQREIRFVNASEYGVDSADYTSAIAYGGTAATAEQIAVFEAKDSAAAERILSALQTFVAEKVEAYKSYGPAAAMSLENAPVKIIGNCVVAVVCADSDSALKVVDQYA